MIITWALHYTLLILHKPINQAQKKIYKNNDKILKKLYYDLIKGLLDKYPNIWTLKISEFTSYIGWLIQDFDNKHKIIK